ncbi:MAG: hypothetical protein Q8L88_09680 [Bacteroidota bacterium]|nr:hypothetical protein [Bacteroidota bacterium]
MGSQVVLDLISATIIFGSLLVIGLRMNAFTSDNMQRIRGDVIVQQNLVAVISLVEYDFRKIGYVANSDSTIDSEHGAIIEADSNHIRFITDYPPFTTSGGRTDTIEYKFGLTNDDLVSWTPNPNDRYLYRNFDKAEMDNPVKISLGVTRFKLTYYDFQDSNITPNERPTPSSPPNPVFNGNSVYATNPTTQINTIQIDIEIQSWVKVEVDTALYGLDTQSDTLTSYQTAYWRQIRLAAKNLRNR